MEDGDSDTDKYPHRNCNYAGNYQLPRIDDPLPTSPRGGELTLPLGEMEGVTNEVEGDGALGFVCDLCHSLKTFRYVGTPSTVDCVMPHVFQGISTEVTVAASSVVRLNSRDS